MPRHEKPCRTSPICLLRRFELIEFRDITKKKKKTKPGHTRFLGTHGPILHKRSPLVFVVIKQFWVSETRVGLPASLVTSRGTARRTGGRGAQPPLMHAGDAERLNSHRATTQDSRGIGPGCCLLHHRPIVSSSEFQPVFFFGIKESQVCPNNNNLIPFRPSR